jgi:hypothetical protein
MMMLATMLAAVMEVTAPQIDGHLDDACWAKAEWITDFQLFKNVVDDGQPRKATAFAIVQDGTSLYVGVKCAEPDMQALNARPDTGLWSECVEIYLSPGKTTFEFYQFAIGPATKDVFAEFYSEGGNIRPDSYRPVWRHAFAKDEKGWTAEIAIPLSSLYMSRNKDWKSEWLVNFIRTTKTGKTPAADYTWSPLKLHVRESENFNMLSGFPKRAAEEDCAVLAVIANITGREGGQLKGTLNVDVFAGLAGRYHVVTSSGADTELDLKAGNNKIVLPCVYAENGRNWTHFKVQKVGFARACERDFPVMVDFRPIRVKLTQPGYRNNFYPGQKTDRIAGRVTVGSGKEAKLTLTGEGFTTRTLTFTDGSGDFDFDTTGFKVGTDAFLTVVADGAEEKVRIRNLAPTGRRMTWIENGNFVVNGKPVIRRTLDAMNWHQGKANWEKFQKERASFRLTEDLQNVGIEAMRMINGIEQREGIYDRRPSDAVFAKMDEKLAQVKDTDYACWFIIDEPECRNISPVWLKHQYDYLAEKDPYHVITTDSRGGKTYIDCFDVVQTHPYMAPVNCEDGVRRYGVQACDIGSYLDAFEAADRPDKCIGVVPQAFAYRWYSTRNDYLTLEEYLATTWAAILRGAKSVRPYACHDMGDRAQLWEGTRYIFESIEALEDYLLFAKRETLTKSKLTETTLYTLANGEKMVVAVNFTPEKQTASFPGVKGVLREFRGERIFNLQSSAVNLDPFEVVIATTDERGKGLESFKAMAQRVAEGETERLSRDNQILEKHGDVVITSNMDGSSGKFYKLIDGCRDMWAAYSVWKDAPFVEMSFPHFTPVFEKLRVYGYGLDQMKVENRCAGEWQTLEPKSVKTEKWLRELDFGEPVRTVALRFSFPAPKRTRNEIELYEIELPQAQSAAAQTVAVKVKPLEDEGVLAVYGKDSHISQNVTWELPNEARPKWAVLDFAAFNPKSPRQYMAWHVRLETPEAGGNQLLASLAGQPEEAGVYTIRFDPPLEPMRKWITLRDYGLEIDFGGLTLLDKPANRVDLRVPEDAQDVSIGDTIDVKVDFAEPCEDVSAEFLYAFKTLEALNPYAINGKSGLQLKRLDDLGRSWGTAVKVLELPRDVPARCVYVKAHALGGGFKRPLYGNFAVPFVRSRN